MTEENPKKFMQPTVVVALFVTVLAIMLVIGLVIL
jgi:hypothetical protein